MIKSKCINIQNLNINDNTIYLNDDYYLYYFENNSGKLNAIVYEKDGFSTLGVIENPDKYFENSFQKRKRIIGSLLNEKM
jgi:hypothetical protein